MAMEPYKYKPTSVRTRVFCHKIINFVVYFHYVFRWSYFYEIVYFLVQLGVGLRKKYLSNIILSNHVCPFEHQLKKFFCTYFWCSNFNFFFLFFTWKKPGVVWSLNFYILKVWKIRCEVNLTRNEVSGGITKYYFTKLCLGILTFLCFDVGSKYWGLSVFWRRNFWRKTMTSSYSCFKKQLSHVENLIFTFRVFIFIYQELKNFAKIVFFCCLMFYDKYAEWLNIDI